MLKKELFVKRRSLNILQSTIIIVSTAILLGVASFFIFGLTGVLVSLFILFLTIFFIPKLKPLRVLKNYDAKLLEYHEVPNLYNLIYKLSKNANLNFPPKVYYIKDSSFICFSTGSKDNSAIALSDGMLRVLNYNELYGVLGHEISHIKNNDIWLMQVCDSTSRLTTIVSYLGQFIMLIIAPFLFMNGETSYFWTLFLLFLFIPPISILMQLSLSRIREYGADLDSAYITGDPSFLREALLKLDKIEEGILSKLNPFNKIDEPSVLRTHPPTSKRIQRLKDIDIPNRSGMVHIKKDAMFLDKDHVIVIKPRRNYKFWY